MTISVFPFLRLVSVCGAALMGSSCLPMFGAGQVLAGSSLADGLLPSSSLDLVWRGDIRSFPSSGLRTPRGFKVSPADSYSLLMGVPRHCRRGPLPDRNSYYWAFVAGKKEEEAGLYAVRRGMAVNGISGEIEDAPAAQDVRPPSVM
ncbi:MAG: hypothetical protein ACLT8E_11815 [Akkermansia sp.]